MIVSLNETKQYLRVDFDDDNSLIESLIKSAEQRCLDIMRTTDTSILESNPNTKIAILYSVAFLYENREKADHNELNRTLRALLFGSREERF